jgi:hypothetical protein
MHPIIPINQSDLSIPPMSGYLQGANPIDIYMSTIVCGVLLCFCCPPFLCVLLRMLK